MIRILGSLIVLGLVFGCTREKYEAEKSQLSDARARWVKANTPAIAGYVFNSRLSCECIFTSPVRITVAYDSIVSINDIQSLTPLPDSEFKYFRTINDWFDWIGSSLDRNPSTARVTYDTALGYPSDIYFDFVSVIADDETGLKIDSLHLMYHVPY
jgi:hypothetical protein